MRTQTSMLRRGEQILPMEVKTLEGTFVRIDPKGAPLLTILYVWDPNCGWCRRNEANARALALHTRGRYQMIALSLSRLEAGDSSWPREFADSVYHQPTEPTKRAYSLGGVPQTIVISKAGTVEMLWRGAYVGGVVREVEEYFGIRLPGVR